MIEIICNDGTRSVQNDELGKAVSTAQNYFTSKATLETELNEARRQYANEKLQEVTRVLNNKIAELRDTTIATIGKCFADTKSTIATKKARIEKRNAEMSADLLVPDFKFLESGAVKLTESELQKLVDRNPDNALFARKAREYSNENKIAIVTPLERIESEEMIINNAISTLQGFIQKADITGLSIFLKRGMGEFDTALSEEVIGWYIEEPEESPEETEEKPVENFFDIDPEKLDYSKISHADILDPAKYTATQHAKWQRYHSSISPK